MSPYNFERTYDKWKWFVFKANVYVAALSLVVGLIEYLLLKEQGLPVNREDYYRLCYVLLPLLYHLVVIGGGFLLMKRCHFTERNGDYVPMLQLLLICIGNTVINHEYPIVAASLCFPIFVSIIFDNPRMTRNIWLLSHIGLVALYVQKRFTGFFRGAEDDHFTEELFVTGSMLLAAYITGNILAGFQAEKKKIMESMYQHELQLKEELNKCPKTGLLNSSAFQNRLYRETEKSRFTGWALRLLIMDMDNFKRINDIYGHAKGDKVLILMADIIKKHFKAEEFPSRFGGETFAVIVREGTVPDLKSRMDAMNRDFQTQLFTYIDEPVTISVGIAEWKQGMTDEQLFDCADKALQRARNMGRNRIVVWSDAYEKI